MNSTVEGKLIAICITPRRRGDLHLLDQVEAVAQHGLVGDRYYRKPGSGNPTQEVTLIESEALDALAREHNIKLDMTHARRNLITQGIALNELVGKKFHVGKVLLHGLELCDPCKHLEALTCKGVLAGLENRGGLRAEIVEGGILQVGNNVYVG